MYIFIFFFIVHAQQKIEKQDKQREDIKNVFSDAY